MASQLNATSPNVSQDIVQFETDMKWTYAALSYSQYFTSTVEMSLAVLAVIADIFLSNIFMKNKKLQTKTNKYIMHYIIWHLIFTIFSTAFFQLTKIVSIEKRTPIFVYYTVFEIDKLSLLFIYLFALGLAVDWLIEYNAEWAQKFNKVYDFSIYIIYTTGFVYFVVKFSLLVNNNWVSRHILSDAIYFSIIFLIAVFNYFYYKNRDNKFNSYSLKAASVIILFRLPLRIYYYLIKYSQGYYILHTIFLLTSFVPQWFSLCTNLVLVVLLGKSDKNIRKAYFKSFKKKASQKKQTVEDVDKNIWEIDAEDLKFEENKMSKQPNIVYI